MTATAADAIPPAPAKVTYRSVLKHHDVKILAASRAAVKMAGSTLSYGAMVYLAQIGASQIQISAVNAAQYLAALIFGMQGGVLADTLSKRFAMLFGFCTQAALCILIPIFLGTEFGALLLLMFLTSLLNQVISPSLKATVAIVSSPEEMATCSALVSLIGSVASAIGSGFLAPILMKTTNIEVVVGIAGLLYVIGAIRIYRLPDTEKARGVREALHSVDWKPRSLSLRYNARWVYEHRPVASMMLIGGMCGAMFEGFNSLIPLYVAEVLDSDPANAIYIFAPAAIGYIVGAVWGPALMHRFGERRLAIISLLCMVAGLALFGIIDAVATPFAAINPLRLLTVFGLTFSTLVLAAGMIAVPANFGSTSSGQAVQTYINRNVPVQQQGGIFGLNSVQNNALNLVTIMGLGIVAEIVGPQLVFLVAPLVIGMAMAWFLRYSYLSEGKAAPTLAERREFFTVDPDAPDAETSATDVEPGRTANETDERS
jgi:MFS family permease